MILVASILTPISNVANAAQTVTEISFPDGDDNVRWIVTISHPETVNCSETFNKCSFDVEVGIKWIQDMSAGIQASSGKPSLPLGTYALPKWTYQYPRIVDERGKELTKIIPMPTRTTETERVQIKFEYGGPGKVKFGMTDPGYNRGLTVTGAGYINLERLTEEQQSVEEEEIIRAQDWYEQSESDGFTSYYEISKGYGDDEVHIGCEKRKLYVNVFTPYALSIGWTGSGQYKFDNQKPIRFTYTVFRTLKGVSLNNPKAFTSKLLKSEENFSFKMSSVEGTYTFEHTKGNISDLKNKFKRRGCSL